MKTENSEDRPDCHNSTGSGGQPSQTALGRQETDAQPQGRKRATRAEKQERIDFAYQLLRRGLRKSQIKKEFYARYGVSYRTVERYLAGARQLSHARARMRDIKS